VGDEHRAAGAALHVRNHAGPGHRGRGISVRAGPTSRRGWAQRHGGWARHSNQAGRLRGDAFRGRAAGAQALFGGAAAERIVGALPVVAVGCGRVGETVLGVPGEGPRALLPTQQLAGAADEAALASCSYTVRPDAADQRSAEVAVAVGGMGGGGGVREGVLRKIRHHPSFRFSQHAPDWDERVPDPRMILQPGPGRQAVVQLNARAGP
jgi:hypothetical protein